MCDVGDFIVQQYIHIMVGDRFVAENAPRDDRFIEYTLPVIESGVITERGNLLTC
jgi:hypothetical protein